ncbi:MAG: transcriptional repressor [Desulfatiglandaceae bacterium]
MKSEKPYRMTQQREVILNELKNTCSHLTADEIYEKVRKKMPHISMGTVYRNLDILATCGFIKKIEPDRPQMYFDGNTDEHYHITCVRCGRIEDAPFKPSDDSFENLENALGNLTKHGIFSHKLEFIGLCPRCMAEENDAEDETPE